MDIINISSVTRFLIRKGVVVSHAQVKKIISGEAPKGALNDEHKKKLCQFFDDAVQQVKENILKS